MPTPIAPTGPVSLIVLRRVDPQHNMARYYALSVQPTLFGGAALVREWGRIGGGARMRVELHAGEAAARSALRRLAAAKCRRGYRPAVPGDNPGRTDAQPAP